MQKRAGYTLGNCKVASIGAGFVGASIAYAMALRDVALSVPSVVGPAGVQQRIREKWKPEEYRGFFDAVETVRQFL